MTEIRTKTGTYKVKESHDEILAKLQSSEDEFLCLTPEGNEICVRVKDITSIIGQPKESSKTMSNNRLWKLHIEGTDTKTAILGNLWRIIEYIEILDDDETMNNMDFDNLKIQLSLDTESKNPDGTSVNS